MAQFGRKMGSLKALKKTLEKGSSNSNWIKYIPKNGSKTVRFLEEPEHWVNYLEHFDSVARRSFPCTGESDCPGCLSNERKSSRYLANAIEIDDQGGERLIALQLPKDLANRLVVRYERNGTITDRDYELMRSGEGLDTIYELDALAPRKRNMSKHTPIDLIQVLEDAYKEVFGDDDEDDAPVIPAPKPKARTKSQAASKMKTIVPADEGDEDAEDDVEVDEDDDEDEAPPIPKPAEKAAAKKKGKPLPEPEFEPDEDDEDDDEDAYDEDTLRNLPLGALRAVARNEFGVNPKGMTQDQIVDAILEAGEPVEEDGDDEPPF
jgi:hypothetical protein